MISRRFLPQLLALLLLALVPTIRHGYLPSTAAAPRVGPDTLPASLGAISRAAAAPRSENWVRNTFSADSWTEATYEVAPGRTLHVFVVTSFDLKKLYHHPELALLRGRQLGPERIDRLPGGSEPVHVLENRTGAESAVYALIYDGAWVENPYTLQLSSAMTSLWTGPRPVTLVFVYGDVLRDARPSAETTDALRATVARLT